MKSVNDSPPRGPLRREALQALREAVAGVIAEHKRIGMPLIIWRDGKVVAISPEEAEAEYNAARAAEEGRSQPPDA
jgi:hypothetical protein